MKRILINLVLMVLAFTVQTCIFPLIPFFSASPNLLLIMTFSMGFIMAFLQESFWIYLEAEALDFTACCLFISAI